MKNLTLRLVLLSVMVGSLVIFPTSQTTKSSTSDPNQPCEPYGCCGCYQEYEACRAGCPGLGQGGHFMCIASCNNQLNECSAFCDPTCNDCQ